jgi:hypothetical protein
MSNRFEYATRHHRMPNPIQANVANHLNIGNVIKPTNYLHLKV